MGGGSADISLDASQVGAWIWVAMVTQYGGVMTLDCNGGQGTWV